MEHPVLVKNLCKTGEAIMAGLTPDRTHALHMAVGIAGEAGELLDAIKKIAIYGKEPDLQHIIEELGDLEFYMEGLRQGFGISRDVVLSRNISKLTKRYGAIYSDSAAIQRADKE